MITIPFFTGELVFTAIWLIIRIIAAIKNGKIDWKHEGMLLLMYVNLAVIIRITFFPMKQIDGMIQPLVFDPSDILPFKVITEPFSPLLKFKSTKEMLINIIGNFTMFIPTGVILPLLYKKLNTFWRTLAVGFLMSLSIELLQLLLRDRITDINDVILNTLGAAAGYCIYALFTAKKKKAEQP